MLEKYRREYRDQKVQFIFVDYDGTVVESDQTLFSLIAGSKLSEVHPFFESVSSLLESSEEVFKFFCIHLKIQRTSLIADVKMMKKDEGFLVIIEDLSEHYESYQSVAQSRNESIIKTELTVIKNQELEERERFKNSFIQNFSHEIRNPLTGIMAISDILAATSLNGEQRKMLDFLKHSNSNLSLMLEDILNISSIGSGRLVLQQKLFSLTKLFKLLEFTYRTKAKKKNLEFYCHLDEKVPEFVEGDRLRIYQVLTNLLDNALKYTTKGSVKLSLVFNQKWANKVSLRFEVSDTANGIPQESFDTIFESFTQLNTENKANGSGLGLAIVKGLLELMGSKIRLNSTVGEGSVFYFDLLLQFPVQTLPVEIMDSSSMVVVPEKIKKKSDKFRLLVVEDDEHIQTVILKMLIDVGFFHVEVLNDGADVMKELVNSPYDLVLMDIDLPNVSGDHLTSLIRDFPFKNIKNIPIVGLTANAFPEQVKTYRSAGMNEVVTKPFEKEDLLKTIFRILK